MSRTSVLVVSPEAVTDVMAGPAIRAYELARALAAECDVTLACPPPCAPADPRIARLPAEQTEVEKLWKAAREHDVVLAQELSPTLTERLAKSPTRLVVDLYNPIVVEVLEALVQRPKPQRKRIHEAIVLRTLAQAAAADYIVCANERQRDLWLGGLAMHRLLDPETYAADPTLRSLIDVVPFGIPAEPAPSANGAIRSAFPSIPAGDRVLIWGGGVWGWLDPQTPMRAVQRLEGVHLVLLGAGRPGLATSGQAGAVQRAVAAAREHDRVHVNEGWVPYAQRGAWLAEADLGVSAHHEHLEARFAHRTRILDYVWAGLPVVTTAGDALADLVERERIGLTVPFGDDAAFAEACARLLDGGRSGAAPAGAGGEPRGGEGAAARDRLAEVAPALRWAETAKPLVAWCATARERPRRDVRRGIVRRATLAQYVRMLPQTFAERGPRAVAGQVGRRLRRAVSMR